MTESSAARSLDLLIVGAGFAGLYMLHKARQIGLRARGLATIEAGAAAEAAWVAHVNTMAGYTIFLSCDSWYLGANVPGKPRMFMPLVGGFPLYADQCAAVARQGYEGFVLG